MVLVFTPEKVFFGIISGLALAGYLISMIIFSVEEEMEEERQKRELAWILKKMDNIRPNSSVSDPFLISSRKKF